MQATPVVALNRAVAVAMAGVPEDGLRLLDDPDLALGAGRVPVVPRGAGATCCGGRGRRAEAAGLTSGRWTDDERGGAGIPGAAAARGWSVTRSSAAHPSIPQDERNKAPLDEWV